MEAQPREIRRYTTEDGKVPFEEWFESLRDTNAKAKIISRLNRVRAGNLGDYQPVGEGVCEFRIQSGLGYRVYFGQIGFTIVIILCGGDKSSQDSDIRVAKEYWEDYEKRENADK